MSGLHLSPLTLDAIAAEYVRAHIKHAGHTPKSIHMSDGERLTVLVEEIGEVARAMTYDNADLDNLIKELIQVAAMAGSWAEFAMGERDAKRNGLAVAHRNSFTREKFTGPIEDDEYDVSPSVMQRTRGIPDASQTGNATA